MNTISGRYAENISEERIEKIKSGKVTVVKREEMAACFANKLSAKAGYMDTGYYRDEITMKNGVLSYLLHDHEIITWDTNTNIVTVDDCGYPTQTTRDRMHNVLTQLIKMKNQSDPSSDISKRFGKLIYWKFSTGKQQTMTNYGTSKWGPDGLCCYPLQFNVETLEISDKNMQDLNDKQEYFIDKAVKARSAYSIQCNAETASHLDLKKEELQQKFAKKIIKKILRQKEEKTFNLCVDLLEVIGVEKETVLDDKKIQAKLVELKMTGS